MVLCTNCGEEVQFENQICPNCQKKLDHSIFPDFPSGTNTQAPQRRPRYKKPIIPTAPSSRPIPLIIISIYEVICGLPYLLISIVLFFSALNNLGESGAQNAGSGVSNDELLGFTVVYLPIFLFFALGPIICAIFLFLKREWARKGSIFICILSMFIFMIGILFPFSILIGGIFTWYLFKTDTVDIFVAWEVERDKKKQNKLNSI